MESNGSINTSKIFSFAIIISPFKKTASKNLKTADSVTKHVKNFHKLLPAMEKDCRLLHPHLWDIQTGISLILNPFCRLSMVSSTSAANPSA